MLRHPRQSPSWAERLGRGWATGAAIDDADGHLMALNISGFEISLGRAGEDEDDEDGDARYQTGGDAGPLRRQP